jgi:hypothetical protein
MRSLVPSLAAVWLVAGCSAGGVPAVQGASPPPFDAFQASMRLAVGMPRDVAILRVGWTHITSEVTTCGVLAGYGFPCELLKFGLFGNNQLDVYLAPTDAGAVVNSWVAHKY